MSVVAKGKYQPEVDVWFVSPEIANPFVHYYAAKYTVRAESAKRNQLALWKEYSPREIKKAIADTMGQIAAIGERVRGSKEDAAKEANRSRAAEGRFGLDIAKANALENRTERQFENQEISEKRLALGRSNSASTSRLPKAYDPEPAVKTATNLMAETSRDSQTTDAFRNDIGSLANQVLGQQQRSNDTDLRSKRAVGALLNVMQVYGDQYRQDPIKLKMVKAALKTAWQHDKMAYHVSADNLAGGRINDFIDNYIDAVATGGDLPSIYTPETLAAGDAAVEAQDSRAPYQRSWFGGSLGLRGIAPITKAEAAEMQAPFKAYLEGLKVDLAMANKLYGIPNFMAGLPEPTRRETKALARQVTKEEKALQASEREKEQSDTGKVRKQKTGKGKTPDNLGDLRAEMDEATGQDSIVDEDAMVPGPGMDAAMDELAALAEDEAAAAEQADEVISAANIIADEDAVEENEVDEAVAANVNVTQEPSNFTQAFDEARLEGLQTFFYKGNEYSTQEEGESDEAYALFISGDESTAPPAPAPESPAAVEAVEAAPAPAPATPKSKRRKPKRKPTKKTSQMGPEELSAYVIWVNDRNNGVRGSPERIKMAAWLDSEAKRLFDEAAEDTSDTGTGW